MKDLKKEYDAFGPWIIEVNNREEIPSVFDKYIDYVETFHIYKIPRDITRREANPGDQLYQSIISFEKNQLIFLSTIHGAVVKKNIEYKNIESIQNKVDLLNGTLIIQSKSEKVKIPYNAVSSDLIDEALSRLRMNYIQYFNDTQVKSTKKESNLPKNYFYKGILREMKHKESISVLNAQETSEIVKFQKRWYDHLLDLYNPRVFQKIMFLTNGKELIIISRKDGIKRKRSSDYSHLHTYIPLSNIKSLVNSESEDYENLYIFTIHLDNRSYRFYTKYKLELL